MLEQTEAQLHKQCVEWMRWQHTNVLAHHSPNEGKRGPAAQAALKASGCRAGWPDLELFYRGAVLFIELKAGLGRLSDAQFECHMDLEAQGFSVLVCYDFSDFERTVSNWVELVDKGHLTLNSVSADTN